jgi:hypothetical protein
MWAIQRRSLHVATQLAACGWRLWCPQPSNTRCLCVTPTASSLCCRAPSCAHGATPPTNCAPRSAAAARCPLSTPGRLLLRLSHAGRERRARHPLHRGEPRITLARSCPNTASAPVFYALSTPRGSARPPACMCAPTRFLAGKPAHGRIAPFARASAGGAEAAGQLRHRREPPVRVPAPGTPRRSM